MTVYKNKKSKNYNVAYFGYKNLNRYEDYFGSSKIIKACKKKHGNKFFIRYIVGIFKTTKDGAINESEILQKILKNGNNKLWFNKNIQGYLLSGSPIAGFSEKELKHYEQMCKEKGKRQIGKNNPNYGNKLSDETKRKIALKLSQSIKGENNPNYGNGQKISGKNNPSAVKTFVVFNNETLSFDTKTEAFEHLKEKFGLKSHRFLWDIVNKGPYKAKQKRHMSLNGLIIKTEE